MKIFYWEKTIKKANLIIQLKSRNCKMKLDIHFKNFKKSKKKLQINLKILENYKKP